MSSRKGASTDTTAGVSAPEPPLPPIRRLRVADLVGEAKEAILEHEGQEYRLRITSNRKLILTK
jgi:hemin uptake protein HemP